MCVVSGLVAMARLCVCLPQWRFIGVVSVYSVAVYVYSDLSTSHGRYLCLVTDVVKAVIRGALHNLPRGAELFLSFIPVIFATPVMAHVPRVFERPWDFLYGVEGVWGLG